MEKVMTRVFNAQIVMKGAVCELTKEEASKEVEKQIQELYPNQKVAVECVTENIE